MFFINLVACEWGILQTSHPGLLMAMVSKQPDAFTSPIKPNLLPVNFSATARHVRATSLSLSQVNVS